MRPPLITGENFLLWLMLGEDSPASMRPPLITGENKTDEVRSRLGFEASMRPPLITGENMQRTSSRSASRALQ